MAFVDVGRLAALEPGWQETWSLLYANLLSEVHLEARHVVDPTDADQLQAFLAGSWLAFHSIRRELLAGRLPALTRPSTRPTAPTHGASRPRAHTRSRQGRKKPMNCEDGCRWRAVLLEGANTVFNAELNDPNWGSSWNLKTNSNQNWGGLIFGVNNSVQQQEHGACESSDGGCVESRPCKGTARYTFAAPTLTVEKLLDTFPDPAVGELSCGQQYTLTFYGKDANGNQVTPTYILVIACTAC